MISTCCNCPNDERTISTAGCGHWHSHWCLTVPGKSCSTLALVVATPSVQLTIVSEQQRVLAAQGDAPRAKAVSCWKFQKAVAAGHIAAWMAKLSM